MSVNPVGSGSTYPSPSWSGPRTAAARPPRRRTRPGTGLQCCGGAVKLFPGHMPPPPAPSGTASS
ncbi:hypothetical protein HU200_006617 [Digitaria exilis]|uniref:Uncharacterized protein n=1 Tax=Digitaria exilis TaxID=1010633 RepID=A0A835KQG9_9POAL|nr:hypothetical protein HU200_006617 [Digitaria exilis]